MGKFDNYINVTAPLHAATVNGKLGNANELFLEGDTQNVENELKEINSRHEELNKKHDTLSSKYESLSRTVQGIAVTGGASTATNVTYNNDNSGLNAENVQDAIDELANSENIKYNNETSGLDAGNVQAAIDELNTDNNKLFGQLEQKINDSVSIFSFVGKGVSDTSIYDLTYKKFNIVKNHVYDLEILNIRDWKVSELDNYPDYSTFTIEEYNENKELIAKVVGVQVKSHSKIRSSYKIMALSNGYLEIGFRGNLGNVIHFNIVDETIIQEKVSIFAGKNILSISSFTENGNFIVDGTLNNNDTFKHSNRFFPIEENTEYCLSANTYLGEDASYCCFYDRDKNFISSIQVGYVKTRTFTTPENTAYIRLSLYTTAVNDDTELMLEKGSARTDYEPYNEIGGYLDNVNLNISKKVNIKIGKNILNKSWFTRVGRYNSDGSYDGLSKARRTPNYINVEPLTSYTLSSDSEMGESTYYLIYYNINKEVLGSQAIEYVKTKSFTTPENCEYIRLSLYKECIDNIMLELGQVKTDYEPYNEIGGYGISDILADISKLTTKIDEIKGSLETTVNDLSIPSYFKEHINTKILSARNNISKIDMNGDSFIFISDVHWGNNAKHSPALINKICQNLPINDVIFGGDAFNGGNPESMIEYLNDFGHRMALSSKHFFSVFGNHDGNTNDGGTGFSHDMFYSFLQRYSDDYVEYGKIGYYYSDNKSTKTRKIFLDTYHGSGGRIGTPEEQLNWLTNLLSNTPQGYHIIVFLHIYYYDATGTTPTTITEFVTNIANILDSHNSNRKTNDAFIEAIFAGHLHFDFNTTTSGGIPVVLIDCDSYSQTCSNNPHSIRTIGEQAFDIVTIDYTNKSIKCTRVGRGSDRNISY